MIRNCNWLLPGSWRSGASSAWPRSSLRRRVNGEFFVSEITVTVEAPNGGSERLLDIEDGFADFSRESYPVSGVFDRDQSTSWGVRPRLSERHTAVFGLESNSAADVGKERLKVQLQSAARDYPQMNLGRFRLSVTNQVGAFRAARLRNDLKDSEFVDLNIALAKAHAQQGNMNGAVASIAEGLSVAGDRAGKAKLIRRGRAAGRRTGKTGRASGGRCAVPGRALPIFCRTWQRSIGGRGPHQSPPVVRTEAGAANRELRVGGGTGGLAAAPDRRADGDGGPHFGE
jgi:hypothetical protein